MKLALTGAACVGLLVSTGGVPLIAQMQDNTEKQMSCQNGGYDGERARHCEMREQSVASIGHLTLDASPNGGITVKGWLRGDTLVRARIEGSAETAAAAATLVSQVSIDTSGGLVRAMGPQSANNSYWSVSYEIFVPQNTDLDLKSHNGGLNVSDVRGQLHFGVTNGGVHLKRVAGDVSGSTVNGGVQVELAGPSFDGRQLEVSTHNGGVTIAMPSNYSAHFQAETNMGGIQSDFPLAVPMADGGNGNMRPRKLDSNIGGGGALIHVSTVNGQVRLKKSDTQ
ncbi:MAG TPA: hypothetical protein VMH81_13275 [Bryobacteraceae bacterium]|nr:hypothetical protein [Bryobacteraceae bacterium]